VHDRSQGKLRIPGGNAYQLWRTGRTEFSVRESRMAALLNSIAVAIFATLIAMALGVPAGYALARFKFRRVKNRDLTIWYLSQRVLPPVVVVIPSLPLKQEPSRFI